MIKEKKFYCSKQIKPNLMKKIFKSIFSFLFPQKRKKPETEELRNPNENTWGNDVIEESMLDEDFLRVPSELE